MRSSVFGKKSNGVGVLNKMANVFKAKQRRSMKLANRSRITKVFTK